jgi:acyl-CoA synthetase (AMP-forming)/AMP-acid ligase II
MSEIGSVTFNHPARESFDALSVGRPMRDVSVRILEVGPARRALPPGDDGEVAVRAPSMLSGYVGDDTPLFDGHFPTGDLGRLDERGNLTITGRVRLLIDTGGMKVNPVEVEAVLAGHPEVMECVVVPVKQSRTVQRLCALIVPRNATAPPSSDSIRRFAKEKLAAYKVPRLVEFRPSLPRTATGKVIRHLLEVAE